MRAIYAGLQQESGPGLDWETIASWTGEAHSTAFERFHRNRQPQIEGFLRLLERLPSDGRRRVQDEFLRTFPSFRDRRLSHDKTQIDSLRWVLDKRLGTTVVYGSNAEERTYLAAAMARDAGKLMEGLDVHRQSWFVGAASIRYLEAVLPSRQLADSVRFEFTAPMVLFNGVYLKVPAELRQRIRALGKHRHLLLVDAFDEVRARDWATPVHTVRLVSGQDELIHAEMESW